MSYPYRRIKRWWQRNPRYVCAKCTAEYRTVAAVMHHVEWGHYIP